MPIVHHRSPGENSPRVYVRKESREELERVNNLYDSTVINVLCNVYWTVMVREELDVLGYR